MVKRTLHIMDYGYALPIEITAIRNFHGAHWVRDLELEFKNISTKPIYEIYFHIFLPDDQDYNGAPYAVYLDYGRFHLVNPGNHPLAEDAPIWPGQAVVLKVDRTVSRGYEYHLANDNVQGASSYKVRMAVLAVNFGDGTGFINGGVPYPGERGVPKPVSRYVKIPVDTNQQSLRFQIVDRPAVKSDSPSGFATDKVHTLDCGCPSSCDGNKSTNETNSSCNPSGVAGGACIFQLYRTNRVQSLLVPSSYGTPGFVRTCIVAKSRLH